MTKLCPLRLEVATLEGSPSPLDLELIKTHCKIDDTRFDSILPTYLLAATLWAEGETHRTIFSRSHTWVLKEFPIWGRQEIRLPRGRTRSVESVQYKSGGQTFTLTGPSGGSPGDDFLEDLRGDDGGILMPVDSWPSVDCDVPDPVVVTFTSGWDSDEVPSDVIIALSMHILFQIDHRREYFDTAEMLMSGYRLSRTY